MWIKVIKEAVLVVLVATALAGASYVLRPGAITSNGNDSGAGSDGQNTHALTTISFSDARRHFEQGSALFADARSLSAYRSGHIPGAMHLDPDEFDSWSGDFFSQVSPDQFIITYCEGVRCTLSLELAERLNWMGYEKVSHLKNGWGLWKEHQLPMEVDSD